MSIYEMIAHEAEEQRKEDGRPLPQYVLTPAEWEKFCDEMAESRIGTAANIQALRAARAVTINIFDQSIKVIKGS